MKAKILVIDDEENIRFTFKSFLEDEMHEVVTASDYKEALTNIDGSDFDLIYADIMLEGETGIDFLREVRKRNLNTPVIIITGNPMVETASDAVRLGAFDYIPKPVLKDTLLRITNIALQHKALTDEKEKYRSNLDAIFSSVKDAIIAVDNGLSVLEFNNAAKGTCGLSRDAVGKALRDIPKQCNGRCIDALKETISKKQPVEIYRLECQHEYRPHQVVNITTHPLHDNKGVFSGAILVVRDETRLANLEDDLKERQQFHNIVGKSEKMQAIYTLIENLADVQTTVLIMGESGTGKELIADSLHYKGCRGRKPFIKVNCATLSEGLLESELFGHVKGAFTGAVQDRIGRFQMADGGTIFLDEIGDISPRTQLQLLRVLQEREFERVGDSKPVKVDVRVVAATNQHLPEKIKRGEFREDLYYRLKVVEINLPPLRERREDIPLLVNHFLNKFNKKLGREIVAISSDVQRRFMEYQWPGNVRELEHTLEHAFVLCPQQTITVNHLPPALREYMETKITVFEDSGIDERQAILESLQKTAWNKAKAARLLGMSRRTLYRKLVEYKLLMEDT